MATAGFTAEASHYRASRHYRRISLAPAPAGGLLGFGRLALPVPRSRVQPAQGPLTYGRHCGIGHSSFEAPIDAVDEVCCRHDKCYCERGYFDCSCDRNLILDMPGAIADPSTSAEGRAKGTAIAALLAADPFCLCHRICHPGWPDFWNWECSDAGDLAVPGIPPLKLCPAPFA
jgi:hypothetical protein